MSRNKLAKPTVKRGVDLLMTVALLFLMSYSLVGEAAHEWVGMGMFLLFVVHLILNRKWVSGLRKGRWPAYRGVQTVIVLLCFLAMIGAMFSGIILSEYLFASLRIRGWSAPARQVHLLCSYWGFVFMSLHLGLHWSMVLTAVKQLSQSPLFRRLGWLAAAYGLFAFWKRDLPDYLLLRTHFVFFDYEEPIIFFCRLSGNHGTVCFLRLLWMQDAESEENANMKTILLTGLMAVAFALSGCGNAPAEATPNSAPEEVSAVESYYTAETLISEVMADPAFGDYGRLIFPVQDYYYSGDTLGKLGLTYYSHIDPEATVEIANYMRNHAEAGEFIFYDIYTDEEKAAEPAKADTGLFFFKGEAGKPFAVCNAGGAFAYVGAMHDSFPHALALSKQGYNAFALIYRPGAQSACEDLARAISFIFAHAEELEVDTDCYSLWGGSAGARMAAYLGSYGPAAFGGDDLPRPGSVIMQYTGHSEYNPNGEPPTFAVAGDNDGIANWRTMERRINAVSSMGVDTEFHHYSGLGHGFGLGTGTSAEGWIDLAVAFWEKQMEGSYA